MDNASCGFSDMPICLSKLDCFLDAVTQGLRKPLFCVLKDELFTPEDELSWADGQK